MQLHIFLSEHLTRTLHGLFNDFLCFFRRGRELEIYTRFSGSSYCFLGRLVQDYKNGTGEFYDDGEGKKMKKLK